MVRPGECWEITRDGTRRIEALYPAPAEPHSAADLLAPLATDNVRLRKRCKALLALMAELANEVEAAVEHDYNPIGTGVHPSQRSRYERDMAIVKEARSAIDRGTDD